MSNLEPSLEDQNQTEIFVPLLGSSLFVTKENLDKLK